METSKVNVTASYPLELHCIKALCLRKQYRQCIQACRETMDSEKKGPHDNPVWRTFVTFYIALAHDELARLMHHYSQAKIPAFDQAELFYKEALALLPCALQFCRTITGYGDVIEAASLEGDVGNSALSPTILLDRCDDGQPQLSHENSPPKRSPVHLHAETPTPYSKRAASQETSSSGSSDLERRASHGQAFTPGHVLPRSTSRISLIESAPRPPRPTSLALTKSVSHLPRDVSRMSLIEDKSTVVQQSMSHGLLRPIRPGSPPQPYHVPPRLPYVGSAPSRSRLPRLVTHSSPYTPSRKQWPDTISEETCSEVTPVPSIDPPAMAYSETENVRPPSPYTPLHPFGQTGVQTPSTTRTHSVGFSPLAEHLVALRSQLESHLRILANSKQMVRSAQAERAVAHHATTAAPGTPLAPVSSRGDTDGGTGSGMQSTRLRSFRSFTPDHVKASEKRKRIDAGRGTGWKRERFDPQRYRDLAEKALAEL